MKRKVVGFSLLELMVVVVIIGILSSGGIFLYITVIKNAAKEAAEANTSAIHLVQQEYKSNYGSYYYTTSCQAQGTQQIITNLMDDDASLLKSDFDYCITGDQNKDTFVIKAHHKNNVTNNCEIHRNEKNEVEYKNC